MKLLGAVILALAQAAALIITYILMMVGMVVVVPELIPGYLPYNPTGDTQAIILLLVVWDRFFGPYSVLLRGVARNLKKAKARKRED